MKPTPDELTQEITEDLRKLYARYVGRAVADKIDPDDLTPAFCTACLGSVVHLCLPVPSEEDDPAQRSEVIQEGIAALAERLQAYVERVADFL